MEKEDVLVNIRKEGEGALRLDLAAFVYQNDAIGALEVESFQE